jgi:hypothetical protein
MAFSAANLKLVRVCSSLRTNLTSPSLHINGGCDFAAQLPSRNTHYNIRHMRTRLIRLFSRLVLFICGTITILLGQTFNVTQVAMPVASIDWFLLSIPLVLVEGLTILIAFLPSFMG